MSPISEALFNGLYDGGSRQRSCRPENNPGTRSPPFPQTLSTGPRFPPRATTALHPQVLGHSFFFFLSWRKSARTPGRFWGEAGLQPTKTSTMAVPAVIERDPRNGVSGTPPPPTAQMHPIMERYAVTSYRASSAEPPCKVVWFLYRTAWRSRGADLPVPKFNPHWGARWI